ncbi:MAG: ABC transporter ATP-binding protein [Eubacteriales bacterium]|nr:ABC transporter ATP-binding protein [Eubacteriales bacterium]
MIEIKNVVKKYGKRNVVDDISFKVKEGHLFALLGSNGAGKSTTIKMLLGLVKKTSGETKIADGKTIGYSPETPYFPPFFNGLEVIRYYGKLQGIQEPQLSEECETLLKMVGLHVDSQTKVKSYSKGMLQRLALAQALLGNPDILILDEPCAGLDAMGRIEMLSLIEKMKEQGKTIIMNSHILSDMERVLDEGIIMKNGKILRTFSKEDITEEETLEKIFVSTVGGNETWA